MTTATRVAVRRVRDLTLAEAGELNRLLDPWWSVILRRWPVPAVVFCHVLGVGADKWREN